MRDIAVTLVVFGLLPLILARPYVGVLAWSWLAYMNPHRLAWGFAVNMPFSLMVAICTFIGLLVSQEPKRIPFTRETVILILFAIWMFITTLFSLYPWLAWDQWDKVWRVLFMTFITMLLITDRQRIHLLMWVIAMSLAFYGIKGGLFVLRTGGVHAVMGPQDSFIGENNSIGLALIMTVPLLRYLQLQATNFWLRHGLTVATLLTLIAILGTHSRGALVGILAMGLFFLLKSRRKLTPLLLAGFMIWATPHILPEQWFERMETIETWQEDGSASERVRAWGNAVRLANERFIGGGFRALVYYGKRDAHSIYFGVLGEHGWLGLGLFMLLLAFTWRSASWIISRSRSQPDLFWARDLASMIQVSLIGYCAAGAFLALQYFDLFYHLIAIIVMTRLVVAERLAEAGTQAASSVQVDIADGQGFTDDVGREVPR